MGQTQSEQLAKLYDHHPKLVLLQHIEQQVLSLCAIGGLADMQRADWTNWSRHNENAEKFVGRILYIARRLRYIWLVEPQPKLKIDKVGKRFKRVARVILRRTQGLHGLTDNQRRDLQEAVGILMMIADHEISDEETEEYLAEMLADIGDQ